MVHNFFTPFLVLTLLMADCPWQLCGFLLSSQRNTGMLLERILILLLEMELLPLYNCPECQIQGLSQSKSRTALNLLI